MNRAEHLYEILKERGEVCTFDIWQEMGTAPMRAFNEAKKMRLPVDNARDSSGRKIMRWINGKNYAVYTLKRVPHQLSVINESGYLQNRENVQPKGRNVALPFRQLPMQYR